MVGHQQAINHDEDSKYPAEKLRYCNCWNPKDPKGIENEAKAWEAPQSRFRASMVCHEDMHDFLIA